MLPPMPLLLFHVLLQPMPILLFGALQASSSLNPTLVFIDTRTKISELFKERFEDQETALQKELRSRRAVVAFSLFACNFASIAVGTGEDCGIVAFGLVACVLLVSEATEALFA